MLARPELPVAGSPDPLAEIWPRLEDGVAVEPFVARGAAEMLGVGVDDVREVLIRYAADATVDTNPPVRCFAGRASRPDVARRLARRPPNTGEDLASWAGGLFGCDDFTLILNAAERWAPRLASTIARAFEPSYAHVARGRVRCELVLVMGRYRATPFGIHQDMPGTHVVHFHAGPGTKRMTLYDPAEYRRFATIPDLAGRARFLAGRRRVFAIEPGDAFYLPAGWFHVGEAREFSAAIACKYCIAAR